MDKESRRPGTGSESLPATPGAPAPADSRQAGKGSESDFFYLNDKGEYCFGTKCFSMRVKPGAGEVRVVVDRNECGDDAQALVDALFGEVVKGAPTVYETVSHVEKKE